jgi:hypothetical protein
VRNCVNCGSVTSLALRPLNGDLALAHLLSKSAIVGICRWRVCLLSNSGGNLSLRTRNTLCLHDLPTLRSSLIKLDLDGSISDLAEISVRLTGLVDHITATPVLTILLSWNPELLQTTSWSGHLNFDLRLCGVNSTTSATLGIVSRFLRRELIVRGVNDIAGEGSLYGETRVQGCLIAHVEICSKVKLQINSAFDLSN